jgi:hypothetical protein
MQRSVDGSGQSLASAPSHKEVEMTAERLSMRKLRELFRLRFEAKLSTRAVAASLNMGNGTVCDYLGWARVEKVTWPLPPELDDDEALAARLFPTACPCRPPIMARQVMGHCCWGSPPRSGGTPRQGQHPIEGAREDSLLRSAAGHYPAAMPPALANGKICYLELPATDVERSAEFYTRVFGWQARHRPCSPHPTALAWSAGAAPPCPDPPALPGSEHVQRERPAIRPAQSSRGVRSFFGSALAAASGGGLSSFSPTFSPA